MSARLREAHSYSQIWNGLPPNEAQSVLNALQILNDLHGRDPRTGSAEIIDEQIEEEQRRSRSLERVLYTLQAIPEVRQVSIVKSKPTKVKKYDLQVLLNSGQEVYVRIKSSSAGMSRVKEVFKGRYQTENYDNFRQWRSHKRLVMLVGADSVEEISLSFIQQIKNIFVDLEFSVEHVTLEQVLSRN